LESKSKIRFNKKKGKKTNKSESRIATTAKGARQLITHKHIAINGKKVDVPSYLVQIDEENNIQKTLKNKVKSQKNSENAQELSKELEMEATA